MLFILLFCLPHIAVSQVFSGTSFSEAERLGTASITAVYLQEPAFGYADDQGRITGITIDIFRQFSAWLKGSKGIDVAITFVPESSFSDFYGKVRDSRGGVFGLGTTTVLDSRRSEVSFSPAFINNVAVLITNNSLPDLNTTSDYNQILGGRKAIVAGGSTLQSYVEALKRDHLPGLSIETTPTSSLAIDKVSTDASYFSYVDLSAFWLAVNDQNRPLKRHPIADLTTEKFAFIMPPGSDWAPLMEEFFSLGTGYRSNPAYKRILMKHLGTEFTNMLEMARQRTAGNR